MIHHLAVPLQSATLRQLEGALSTLGKGQTAQKEQSKNN